MKTRAFGLLTGRRIRRLIRTDNSTLETWNDNEYLKGDERDRLGLKEARFQSLLAQVLRENDFNVVVESYFSNERKKVYYSSCDLYAWDCKTKKSYWVEVKRQDLTPNNNSGGKELILQVFSDIGKMKAGKRKGDRVVVWVGFWGSRVAISACTKASPRGYTFRIGAIKPGWLGKAWKGGTTRKSRMKIKRKLGYCGSGSVSDALHDLRLWINANGGMCEIVNATRKIDEENEEWANCGILCGIMI